MIQPNKDYTKDSLPPNTSPLLKQIQQLIALQLPRLFSIAKAGTALAIHLNPTSEPIIQNTLQHELGCDLKQLLNNANKAGFAVRTHQHHQQPQRHKILLIANTKITQEAGATAQTGTQEGQSSPEEFSSEEDFPRESEEEALQARQQHVSTAIEQQKSASEQKSSFHKPNIILHKGHTGSVGVQTEHRRDDASIEVKLKEQEAPLPPQRTVSRREEPSWDKLEKLHPLSLSDRLQLEKDNYEHCARTIDQTIVQLLEAHRSQKSGENKEELLQKVAEVYDMLSNAIDNGTKAAKIVGEREGPKIEERSQSLQ